MKTSCPEFDDLVSIQIGTPRSSTVNMNILLLGKYGQLGWELHRALSPVGSVTALDYPEIDLAQEDSVVKMVRAHHPEVIVNATAYTAVDKAESEPEIAMAINARAPGLLAEEAQRLGALLIHYSTDYVFDGKKGSEYLESDLPNPLGVYGQSKLGGERSIQAGGRQRPDLAHELGI